MAFVQERFREYYLKDFSFVEHLSAIERREFGFAMFEGWMLRHKGFEAESQLVSFLRESNPKDAFSSCAYYEDPEAEMEKKGWLGADLVFDIDADHIPTSCDKVHDKWTCGKCGFSGRGIVPEMCPVCKGEKFEESTWMCEVCLDSAKHETMKLLDMLLNDFGFSEDEVEVFFSGHRGYHVHVEHEAVRSLDAMARKEIVDYVCGLSLETGFVGSDGKNTRMLTMNDFGWRKRIAKTIRAFIASAKREDLRLIGLKGNIIEVILQNRDEILGNLDGSEPWERIKGVGPETWNNMVRRFITLQSANVDTVVTTDVHRLIRLRDTLHGKTGLKKTCFPVSSIEVFDPFKSSVAFKKGNVKVLVSESPEFRLGDQTFGPYKNQKVELPLAAAVLLLCKKRAEVSD